MPCATRYAWSAANPALCRPYGTIFTIGYSYSAALPYPLGTLPHAGDFNSSPDRHLGAAQPLLPAWCTGGGGGGGPPTHGSSPSAPPPGWTPLQPDVLISEATYAATLRDSKRSRERDFLAAVIDTVTAGGKVREGAGSGQKLPLWNAPA